MNTNTETLSTSMRNLCKILNIDDQVRVEYKQPKSNGDFLCYNICVPLSAASAIEAGEYDSNKDYDRSDCGLYIPDMNTDEFANKEKSGNPLRFNNIMKTIPWEIRQEEYSLTYAAFSILHELGHWVYYTESGMSEYEFYLNDWQGRAEADNLKKQIKQVENSPTAQILLPVLCEEHEEVYRNIPSEKAADKYALEHIEKAMERVRESFQCGD